MRNTFLENRHFIISKHQVRDIIPHLFIKEDNMKRTKWTAGDTLDAFNYIAKPILFIIGIVLLFVYGENILQFL